MELNEKHYISFFKRVAPSITTTPKQISTASMSSTIRSTTLSGGVDTSSVLGPSNTSHIISLDTTPFQVPLIPVPGPIRPTKRKQKTYYINRIRKRLKKNEKYKDMPEELIERISALPTPRERTALKRQWLHDRKSVDNMGEREDRKSDDNTEEREPQSHTTQIQSRLDSFPTFVRHVNRARQLESLRNDTHNV